MLDLNPRDKAVIQKILSAHIPNTIVWAYGSRVKGCAHAGSDLDLAILSSQQEKITEQQINALHTAFAESNLPILIDIVDWSTIPEAFRAEIEKKHEVLQALHKKF